VSIEAALAVTRGEFTLDAALTVEDGETVALLGPNGAGKSTLLAALAGLVALDRGRTVLGGVVVDDTAVPVSAPPERRSIGYVFQDHLLFPHLTALDNVAFGLRSGGVAKDEARRRAGDWLARLGVAERAGARPAQLSGGEAQRVALARALAREPHALLLDEPLASLDVETSDQVRGELRRHLAAFVGPRVLVTHDPAEAIVLADRVVVLEGGTVTQVGSMTELTRSPRTAYVARLVGLNLCRGEVRGGTMEVGGGGSLVGTTDPPFTGPGSATIRPQAVALHRGRPEGTPRNVWRGRIAGVEAVGDRVRVAVEGRPAVVAEITTAALADLRLAPGDEIWVSVKATDIAFRAD